MTLKLLDPIKTLGSRKCYAPNDTKRGGVLVHYDDSSSDNGAVEWFLDPTCEVAYNRLYLDNGTVVQITPTMEHAAWHAGVCLTKNANHFFYGLACATNGTTLATREQFASLCHDVAALFILNGWHAADVATRIRGHDAEATWDKTNAPNERKKWGKLGRKVDPTGVRPDGQPIVSLALVRVEVCRLLGSA